MTLITKNIAAAGDDTWNGATLSSIHIQTLFGNLAPNNYSQSLRYLLGGELPVGAVIDDAKLTFYADVADSGTTVNVNIYCEAANNPAAPTTAGDFTGRTRTTAVVNWQPGAWSADTTYDSPDLATIIQELVDAGTSYDTSIQFFIDNNGSSGNAVRRSESYDHASSVNNPTLTINYSVGGISGQVMIFS